LAAPASAEIVERIIAKVNGDIITQTEFEARQVASAQAARVDPAKVGSFLQENNARILQEAIDELLLVQKAEDTGLKVRPEYLKEVIENIKKENHITSDEQLKEQLAREGMSLDDLKRNIERSILRRQILARDVEPKAAVSDAEVLADYEAHKAEYTRPATVKLQEILVKGDGDARAEAQGLVGRARAGEDFAALARAHSAAPTRASGGDLGTLARGDMSPDLEKAAFALAPGQISDPIPTADGGYRILRLADKTAESVVPFDEVKTAIRQRLAQGRQSHEYDSYVAELREKAIIDVRVREVPLQVDVPSAPGTILVPSEGAPGGGAGKPAAGGQEEITTTPQARPERVAPPSAPGEKPKKEEPKPAPSPPPS
jgi:peptidyl-prolyl cis-trans isomerase SurA